MTLTSWSSLISYQETRITRTHDEDGSYSTMKLPSTETRNAVLGNVFICDGEPGKVLRVKASKRIGSNRQRRRRRREPFNDFM